MKRTTTMFFVLALSLMVALPLFANGVTEKGTYFKELDLNTATLEEMESAWEYSVDTYTNQRTTLRTAMDDAMEKRDIEGYVEMRSLYNSLEYPVITKEQTETLKERILNTENQEDKDALASFVYENSVFYRPTLVFDYSVDNGYYTRSYKKALSTLPGTVVTAPEVKGDGVFLGWSLDGETVSYKSGEEITMPYSDTVLYGVFSSGISFNDEITGNSSYVEGTEASVPTPISEDENLIFLGWYDNSGKKLEGDSVTVESGKSKEFTALWEGVEISDASIRYYEEGKIPANTQVILSFPLKNVGNVVLRDLKVTVSGEGVKVLSYDLKASLIGTGTTANASFLVYAEGEKGTEKTITATVSDASGNTWTKDFSFTIQ